MKSDLWLEEKHENFLGMRYKVTDVLYSGKSRFQSIDVLETEAYGRVLLNDGLIMVTGKDEFAYHEMMAHVPLYVHPDPKKVLIVGGGDGGTAREVLLHQSVQSCVLVEIDEMVVDVCRKWIPECARSFDHPKMNLHIRDGVEFVAGTDDRYDVVLIDSTDPVGPAAGLFGLEFYQNVARCLTPNGIVVSQGQSPWYENDLQEKLLGVLNQTFPVVSIYNFNNLTYPGGLWSFTFASKKPGPLDFNSRTAEHKYYNRDVHRAAFALPQFVKNRLQHLLKGGLCTG